VKPRTAISWSGGKDSYLALHRSSASFDIVAMVTMFSEDGARSRSHGLRPEILNAQAERLGLPLFAGRGSWATYESDYQQSLEDAKSLDITHVIFGDIMYESNRVFPERVCAAEGLTAVEPLWNEPTSALFREFVATGAEARIVTVREGVLDASWLGRRLTIGLLDDIERAGIDPCGEHGEYHTVVLDAPLFSSSISVAWGEQVLRSGCLAIDCALAPSHAPTVEGHALGV
jgi:diphthine-ammonia ligase